MTDASEPDGIVLVFIDDAGRPIATSTDFDRTYPAGFSLAEAQEMRAKRVLAYNVVAAYCSPQLVRALDNYTADKLMAELIRSHGCRIAVVTSGHDPKQDRSPEDV
jgi:hypothetical protein